ncbi:hypothetical protein [Shewanella sp.]|uniref:hypothetical protein n=1 Tax=Shewanella sp. TaxID=50422 RepID=UPI003D11A60F
MLNKSMHYITYGDHKYKNQLAVAKLTAKLFNDFRSITVYKPEDIESEFYNKNKDILELPRGGGYWLWKPYIINKKLEELSDGEYLLYCDGGIFLINNIKSIIDEINKIEQDVIGFELPLIEKQWTKSELFAIQGGRFCKYKETPQLMASIILFKKSDISVRFVKEWLNLCVNKEYITDDKIAVQIDEFIDHRHDQSLFSLLYKDFKFVPFKDPTQLGAYPEGYSDTNEFKAKPLIRYYLKNNRIFMLPHYNYDYGVIFYRCRNSNPILALLKYYIKIVLYNMNIFSGPVR